MEQINDYHVRFSELDWYKAVEKYPVIVGGAGGIGSFLIFLLSSTGAEIFVYDDDYVEVTNAGSQFFGHSMIGKSKIEAIGNICNEFADNEITGFVEKFTVDNGFTGPVMFAAFDNMVARKDFFERFVSEIVPEHDEFLLIDGRMIAEHYQIYTVQNKAQLEAYRATLFDDNEVEDAPCTAKATRHCAARISSKMVSFYTNWLTNITLGFDLRVIPFEYKEDLPLCQVQVSE